MVYHSLDDSDHVSSCILCRTEKLGKQTLKQAISRQIEWPSSKHQPPPIEDTTKYVTLDDAFSSIFHFMKVTCNYCKRYYRGCRHCRKIPDDVKHIDRFHSKSKSLGHLTASAPNHTRGMQDLQIVADPGTYSVTTGVWGKEVQQTHVVKLDPGQVVSMDFYV